MMFRLHRFTLSCLPLPSWNLQTRLFFDFVFQFRLLSFSLSSVFPCPLQYCPCHVRMSWCVAITSEFSLLLYGKELIMHSICILGPPANIPSRFMVFVGNVQNSSSPSHLKYVYLDYFRLSGSSSCSHMHKVKPEDHWSLSLTWVLKIC